MKFLSDYKFWIFIISFLQTALMVYGFLVIKYNDFKHLEEDVKSIKEDMEQQDKKLTKIDKCVAVLEERTHNLEKSKK